VTAALIALSLFCLCHLVLTLGLVRRMREHSEVLDRVAGPPPLVMRPAGEVVDDFAATACDGTPVATDLLATPAVVGFFSPGCGPCQERLPEFVARVRHAPVGRALAVVVGAQGETDAMVSRLSEVAVVVTEPKGGPVAEAFGVRAFPAFGLIGEGGRIEASGTDLESIPVLVAA
jgi:hypothetical protein